MVVLFRICFFSVIGFGYFSPQNTHSAEIHTAEIAAVIGRSMRKVQKAEMVVRMWLLAFEKMVGGAITTAVEVPDSGCISGEAIFSCC